MEFGVASHDRSLQMGRHSSDYGFQIDEPVQNQPSGFETADHRLILQKGSKDKQGIHKELLIILYNRNQCHESLTL